MENFKPLNNLVLVKYNEEDMQEGSIILLRRRNDYGTGQVIAIGDEVSDMIEVGDDILFTKVDATRKKIDGEWFVLIEEKYILAILHQEK